MKTTHSRSRALGRAAIRVGSHLTRRRDRFGELIAQTRARVEHDLAAVDAELHAARVERDAADLRYRQLAADAEYRKQDLRRRLTAL